MTKYLCAAVLAVGCTGGKDTNPPDAAPVPTLDPTGNWNVAYSFAPSCGNAATTTTGTFTVTLGQMGYDVEVAGVASTGTLLCGVDACRLSGTFAWMTADTGFQQSMNLTLDTHDTVAGTGTEAVVTTTDSCTYPFTVTGSRM